MNTSEFIIPVLNVKSKSCHSTCRNEMRSSSEDHKAAAGEGRVTRLRPSRRK